MLFERKKVATLNNARLEKEVKNDLSESKLGMPQTNKLSKRIVQELELNAIIPLDRLGCKTTRNDILTRRTSAYRD